MTYAELDKEIDNIMEPFLQQIVTIKDSAIAQEEYEEVYPKTDEIQRLRDSYWTASFLPMVTKISDALKAKKITDEEADKLILKLMSSTDKCDKYQKEASDHGSEVLKKRGKEIDRQSAECQKEEKKYNHNRFHQPNNSNQQNNGLENTTASAVVPTCSLL